MYDIPYFKAGHPDEVLAYMKAHPFALICGVDVNGKPVATQIPFLFEQRGEQLFLQGHFMKKQDHTNAFFQNPNALVVFSGAHSYVSASWYTNKQVASTWNYQTVQVSGNLQFQNEDFLQRVLTRLTERFEKPGSASLVQNMDPQYVRQMMQAIVAFEIEVVSVKHVFKLSQNRDQVSQANIITELNKIDANGREIGQAMEKKYNKNA